VRFPERRMLKVRSRSQGGSYLVSKRKEGQLTKRDIYLKTREKKEKFERKELPLSLWTGCQGGGGQLHLP